MAETAFFIELVKVIGFPAVIFAIWYISHRSQETQQKETSKTFNKIIDEQTKREDRNFKLLEEMLETNQYHGSLISIMCEKIESIKGCPYLKDSQKEKYKEQY